MDTSRISNEMSLFDYRWNPEFNKRRQHKIYASENLHYFRRFWEERGKKDNFIRLVMRDSRPAERYSNRADKVVSFCKNADPTRLLDNEDEVSRHRNVLIDDRKEDINAGDEGITRGRRGPLNPKELLYELLRPRFRIEGVPHSHGSTPSTPIAHEPDAERRVIYVTDPCEWSILAILATTPLYQTSFLREFLYNYLGFTASINVNIPVSKSFSSQPRQADNMRQIGKLNFALEFHLPFYAWRKGQPTQDTRQNGHGKPLRRVQCLDFFNVKSEDSNTQCEDHIFQAEVSFLVAGLDDWCWAAYTFVDTYHDGNDSDDSVFHYHAQAESPDDLPMDPASGGKLQQNRPLWKPRVFYMRVLEARMERVKEEWINVVSNVQQRMYPYVSPPAALKKKKQLRSCSQNRFHEFRAVFETNLLIGCL
ncbi:hypothetical protein BX600DRAFT_280011 [Xylariales sp. PMI_506]|nr:hypothetical protein BX600DRAFT_280011 [Xylariales sp. PMI_506]